MAKDSTPTPGTRAIARQKRAQSNPKKSLEETRAKAARTEVDLMEKYGRWLLNILVGQLFVADLGFFLYAWLGKHWRVEASIMQVWLSATVVEVIGMVYVVTKYLFPERGRGE